MGYRSGKMTAPQLAFPAALTRPAFDAAPHCSHAEAVEVRTLLDDELVAWLCPDCDRQLPPDRLPAE